LEPVESGRWWKVSLFMLAIVGIGGGGLLWLAVNPAVWEKRTLQKQASDLSTEIGDLQLRHDVLTARRDALARDPMALERETRRQFGLVRPGELPMITPPPDFSQIGTICQPVEEATRPPVNWVRVTLYGLFGLFTLTIPALFYVGCRQPSAPSAAS
jgi:hypothetical protein